MSLIPAQVRKEVEQSVALLPKVRAKGFPSAFVDYLTTELDGVKDLATAATKLLAEDLMQNHETVDDVKKVTATMETKVKEVEVALAAARRGIFADVKKNGS